MNERLPITSGSNTKMIAQNLKNDGCHLLTKIYFKPVYLLLLKWPTYLSLLVQLFDINSKLFFKPSTTQLDSGEQFRYLAVTAGCLLGK